MEWLARPLVIRCWTERRREGEPGKAAVRGAYLQASPFTLPRRIFLPLSKSRSIACMGQPDKTVYGQFAAFANRQRESFALHSSVIHGLYLALDEYKKGPPPTATTYDGSTLVQEVENDAFPILSGQLTVALRANLETFCEDLSLLALEHDPNVLNRRKEVGEIKVDARTFLDANDRRKRARIVLEQSAKPDYGGIKTALFLFLPRLAESWKKAPAAVECMKEWRDVRNQLSHRSGWPQAHFLKAQRLRKRPIREYDVQRIVDKESVRKFGDVGMFFSALATKLLLKSIGGDEDLVDDIDTWFDNNAFGRPAG